MYRVFTWKTGCFLREMLVNLPAPWSMWVMIYYESIRASVSESDRKIEDESNQCNSKGKFKSHTGLPIRGLTHPKPGWESVGPEQFSWCLLEVGRTFEHALKRLHGCLILIPLILWMATWGSWGISCISFVSYVDILLIMFVWQNMTKSYLISLWKLCVTSCPIRIFVNEIIHSGRATTAPSLG